MLNFCRSVYKKDIEMMEEYDKPEQRCLTATVKIWKVGYLRTKHVFLAATIRLLFFFSKSTKDVFIVQEVWHSLSTLHTVWSSIKLPYYYNLTTILPPHRCGIIYLPPGDALDNTVCRPLVTVPSTQNRCIDNNLCSRRY